jgi:hypothetical protein
MGINKSGKEPTRKAKSELHYSKNTFCQELLEPRQQLPQPRRVLIRSGVDRQGQAQSRSDLRVWMLLCEERVGQGRQVEREREREEEEEEKPEDAEWHRQMERKKKLERRRRERTNSFLELKKYIKSKKKKYFNDIRKIKRIYCGVFLYRERKSGLVP